MMRICKIKDTKVTVFTTKKIFKRIETYLDDPSKYEIILKDDKESINHYLKRVEKICNEKIHLLFVNTIQLSTINVPHYIKFKPKSKMILTIHLANHWLKQKIALNIKNIPRSLDATISIQIIRKKILPKYHAINVIYPPLKGYIQKNIQYKKPIFTLPFNIYDNNTEITTKQEQITFVIPGLIETYRRDYNLALNVFEKLFKKYNKKIKLILLGKPVGTGGNKIIEKCQNLKQKGYNISFSQQFVPEEEYNKILSESDIIFSPLHAKTIRPTGITEIYGKTEGSALPFEAIQYCKPLIVPEEFNIMNEMKTSTLKYKSPEDLEKTLIHLIENKEKIEKIKKEAYNNSQNFSLEKLQQYFTEEILEKIDKL